MLDGVLMTLLAGVAIAAVQWLVRVRKRARRLEADARRTHGMLVEAELFSGFGCWEHDVRTRTSVWSPGVYALYKRDPAEGPPAFDQIMAMYTPDSERLLREAVDEAIQTGKCFAVEVEARLADGSIAHHCAMGRADRDAGGVVTRLFGTVHDITERKRLADEASHAREDAERASSSKSAFLAHIAHEVRTPLTSVLGYARLIREGQQSPDERCDAASSIIRAGDHMLGLINDVLDQAKIEAGRMTLEEVACVPADLVSAVISMMRPLTVTKGITLQARVGEDVPRYMRMDPMRVRQVLTNLVANAVRFTDTGGVTVDVEARRDLEQRVNGLRFRVRDSGIGMSAEQLQRIFRPFAQASAETARRFGGTGLGLSIAKNLAELMGGSIAVSSEPGRGSVFTVEIACEPSAGPLGVASPAAPAAAGKRGDQWALSGVRILLVDDSPDIIRLIETLLRRAGADVQSALHGLAAVNAVLHRDVALPAPDLILMDVDMPVMSGPEAARRLREIGYRSPILALTAHDTTGRRDELIEAGFDDQLTKPITRDALIAACVKWMQTVDQPKNDEDASRPAQAA